MMQPARFQIAPFFCRPWTLNGMSARLLESHYEHNYGAALTRLNTVTEELEALAASDPQSFTQEQIWILVRAIKVQSQVLQMYGGHPLIDV